MKSISTIACAVLLAWCLMSAMVPPTIYSDDRLPTLGGRMTDAQVGAFARLVLDGMTREFPNKPSNVMVGPESVLSPRQMFPAFYGCFDWHSAVHGHWMLVRLLREYPNSSVDQQIRDALHAHLTRENLEQEADYFRQPHNRSFERMYGWAWALRLVRELHDWDDPQGRQWRASIRPLEEILVQRIEQYLPLLTHPIRTGVHPDTAFALGQILDYARTVGNEDLERLVLQRSRDFYLGDHNYPIHYEPSGEDFFSPGLNVADLMRRVLEPAEFAQWLQSYLPSLDASTNPLLVPAEVPDVTDGKLVHLAGLNLSRAWCYQGILMAVGPDHPSRELMERAAREHAEAGFRYVFSGHYEGEHWLATFAVYVLTETSTRPASPGE